MRKDDRTAAVRMESVELGEGDVGGFSRRDCHRLMWYEPVTGTLDGTSFVVCSEVEG